MFWVTLRPPAGEPSVMRTRSALRPTFSIAPRTKPAPDRIPSAIPREIITPEILREIFNIESEVIYGRDGVPFFIPVGSCREGKP